MEKRVIEINGRRYDAHTGVRLGSTAKAAGRKARRAASHARAHSPARSRLLMRQGVKKPAVKQSVTKSSRTKELPLVRRAESRLAHARQIHKSPQISHFVRTPINRYAVPGQDFHESSEPLIQVHLTATPAPHAGQAFVGQKPQTTAELLEAAIRSATSHEAEPLPRPKRRLFRRIRTA